MCFPRIDPIRRVDVPEPDLAAEAAGEEQIRGDFWISIIQIAARNRTVGAELRGLHEEVLEIRWGKREKGRCIGPRELWSEVRAIEDNPCRFPPSAGVPSALCICNMSERSVG